MNIELIKKVRKYFKVSNGIVRIPFAELDKNKEFTDSEKLEILRATPENFSFYIELVSNSDKITQITDYLKKHNINLGKDDKISIEIKSNYNANQYIEVKLELDKNSKVSGGLLMDLLYDYESPDGMRIDTIEINYVDRSSDKDRVTPRKTPNTKKKYQFKNNHLTGDQIYNMLNRLFNE